MGTTQSNSEPATIVGGAARVDMKLEVVVMPVSDVERAKRFYLGMGWRLDADFADGDRWRVIQVTPPGSACSFFFGTGLTRAAPGSAPGLLLTVVDMEAARAELLGRGVAVGEAFHFAGGLHFTGTQGRLPGPAPERRSYATFAAFDDPDGNVWMLQEITTRLPGRGWGSLDIATLMRLLREAEERHGVYQAMAPQHHWSSWYAAYVVARERGSTPDEATREVAAMLDAGQT
jgi:catechol 2,3-dioxygenase-like lactoylglutathione lyase family enzyme